MSLDYSYTLGYGFFIDRQDLEDAGIKEEYSVYEDAFELLGSIPNSGLLNLASASGMDSERDMALVAVRRSLKYGDPKTPDHTDAVPAVFSDMDDFANSEELAALDAAAEKLGYAHATPKVYFYISVN